MAIEMAIRTWFLGKYTISKNIIFSRNEFTTWAMTNGQSMGMIDGDGRKSEYENGCRALFSFHWTWAGVGEVTRNTDTEVTTSSIQLFYPQHVGDTSSNQLIYWIIQRSDRLCHICVTMNPPSDSFDWVNAPRANIPSECNVIIAIQTDTEWPEFVFANWSGWDSRHRIENCVCGCGCGMERDKIVNIIMIASLGRNLPNWTTLNSVFHLSHSLWVLPYRCGVVVVHRLV